MALAALAALAALVALAALAVVDISAAQNRTKGTLDRLCVAGIAHQHRIMAPHCKLRTLQQ